MILNIKIQSQMIKDSQELVNLCHICLQSLNFEEKIAAENKVGLLVMTLQPLSLIQLLGSIDHQSIFVVLSLLVKLIPTLQNRLQWIKQTHLVYFQWFSDQNNLTINGAVAPYYLVGKLRHWLGEIIKAYYYTLIPQIDEKQAMFEYFRGLSQQLRVLSYQALLEAMNLMDYDMGFIKFRNFMYNFQGDWIPVMFEQVQDFLLKVKDQVQLDPLIKKMETQLKISDTGQINYELQQSKQVNFKSVNRITGLFKNLVDFKYNLDFSQYDDGIEYDGVSQYPGQVIAIIKKGLLSLSCYFLKSLFVNCPQHKSAYQFLYCFTKISFCIDSTPQSQRLSLQACIFVLQQSTTADVKILLLDFSNKALKSIPSFASFFIQNQQLSIKWVQMILNLSTWILKTTNTQLGNVHVSKIASIFNTIFIGSGKSILKQLKAQFYNMSILIFGSLCQYLFKSNNCLLGDNIKDPEQMVSKTEYEFRSWMSTIFLSSNVNFSLLQKIQSQIFSNTLQNINNITNFNLLISYLLSQYDHCFEQNIYYEPIQQNVLTNFGQILIYCYQFYISNNSNINSIHYHQTVLYFMSQFVEAIGGKKSHMGEYQKLFVQKFIPQCSQNKQQILYLCISEICNKISLLNSNIVQYSLKVLKRISKNLNSRQNKKSFQVSINKQLKKSYLLMADNSLKSPQTLECRKSLFRNLSLLISYFDHYCIKEHLNQIFNVISNATYENESLKVLSQIYGLNGTAQGITQSHHMEQFIEVVNPVLLVLNKMVFVSKANTYIVLQTLSIYNSIFGAQLEENRSKSLEYALNTVYQIILPCWAEILNDFNQREQAQQKSLEIIFKIVNGFHCYFSRKNINPYNNRDFTGLFGAILNSLVKSKDILILSLSQCEMVVKLFKLATKNLVEIIFDLFRNEQIQLFYNFYLLVYNILLRCLNSLALNHNDQTSQFYQYSNILQMSTSALSEFIVLRFFKINPSLKSLKPNKIYTNIKLFVELHQESANQLILQFFKIACLVSDKAKFCEVFSNASKQLMSLIRISPYSFDYVKSNFEAQDCSPLTIQELKHIYQEAVAVRNNDYYSQADFDGDVPESEYFELLLKDWAKSTIKKKKVGIDEY